MKKKLFYLFPLLSFVFLLGCKEDEPKNHEDDEYYSLSIYKVPVSDALKIADEIFANIEESKTKSLRNVNSIEYVTTHQTRSNKIDTTLYVVNYADNRGFAILAADKRLPSIYAISDEGNISISDTIENKVLAEWVKYLNYDVIESIKNFDEEHKTRGWEDEFEPPTFGDRKVTYYSRIYPMIEKYPSRWDQRSPYNYYCPYSDTYNVKSLVGCGPLACAQIMSYYEWPESLDGETIDWEYINDGIESTLEKNNGVYICPAMLSHFLWRTGVKLNASYGINSNGETAVSPARIQNNFHKFGYQYLKASKSFSYDNAAQDIKNGPLLMLGKLKNTDYGHIWVMDGYLSYKEEWDAIANEEHTLYLQLYHFIWGWEGKDNGYFLWRADNEVGGYYYSHESSDSGEFSGVPAFDRIEYFYDFTPIK